MPARCSGGINLNIVSVKIKNQHGLCNFKALLDIHSGWHSGKVGGWCMGTGVFMGPQNGFGSCEVGLVMVLVTAKIKRHLNRFLLHSKKSTWASSKVLEKQRNALASDMAFTWNSKKAHFQ